VAASVLRHDARMLLSLYYMGISGAGSSRIHRELRVLNNCASDNLFASACTFLASLLDC